MKNKSYTPRSPERLVSPDGVVHYAYYLRGRSRESITWCEIVGDGFHEIDSWTTSELTIRRDIPTTCLLCLALETHASP